MSGLSPQQRQAFSLVLRESAACFDYSLSQSLADTLLDYLNLFGKWNKIYNLSAIRDPEQMLYKHLVDSLSILPYFQALSGTRFIDVGTGGGLPGIPLAILFPEKHFTLLDSAGKKTRFLFQVKQSLKLGNIQVENRRAETFEPKELYDGVLSRAFASLNDMVNCTHHLLSDKGGFLAMKGIFPTDELRELAKHYIVHGCYPLDVPGLEGERHLIFIKKEKI